MSWSLIANNDDLRAVLATISDESEVAVDTEFMRRNTFFPQVALLQLGVAGKAWLIDPLGITDLEPLRRFLTDPRCLKILHSCSEDLEVFRCWLDTSPSPLVDTQRAAALLGEGFGLGYRGLVERLCAIELDKGETRSNWLQRPLTESQCHYAAQDVLHLIPAWRALRDRSIDLGRLDWIIEEGREVARQQLQREADGFRRVKGSGKLSRRQLETLRRLYDWRERRARTTDKPRGWVLEDRACLTLAVERPGHREALAALDVVPAGLLRKSGDAILECIAEASSTPEMELPLPAKSVLPPDERVLFKTLRDQLKLLCSELGIAPEIALAGADLEVLFREERGLSRRTEIQPLVSPADSLNATADNVSSPSPDPGVVGAAPSRWNGWRRKAIIEPLQQFLVAQS
ncbi:MAG: ribonuclease D [Pseudomonadota bacterium]